GCVSAPSNNIYVLYVGINTNAAGHFELFPVPSNGLFTATMAWPKAEMFTLRVYNSFGSLMFEQKDVLVNGSTKHKIDLSTAPAGIYTVTFTSGSDQINRKMIITRK
ncbi:MAG TPA: T9SS type A sorting domain-containing protein, partial [Bacteroidales bacterium]